MHATKIKLLTLAIASVGAATAANAAGLDRSGQDISAFLQDGTYAEAVYTYIDADVSGKDSNGNDTGDVAESYDFFRYGVKTDINDRFSVGVLYDEPWGAAVKYGKDNNFASTGSAGLLYSAIGEEGRQALAAQGITSVATADARLKAINTGIEQLEAGIKLAESLGIDTTDLTNRQNALQEQLDQANAGKARIEQAKPLLAVADGLEHQKGEVTNVEIRTNSLSLIGGAKFGANRNFQVYGGPVAQRLNGEVHLRGIAYETAAGYDAKISSDTDIGWLAGVAYSKPEIGLKAALTYRSEIEHNTSIAETLPAAPLRKLPTNAMQDFSVKLPESWNLDFQTGLNPTTLLTAKVRYVPWADFHIDTPLYKEGVKRRDPAAYPNGLPIARYAKDQWSAELGLGKRLNDKLAVSGSVGWDSGAGNPVTTLGPIEGYYSVGLGAKYDITPEWSISAGAKYFMFGDADVQIPTQVGTSDTSGKFEDNDGYAIGVKLAYHKK
ncbi:hypothetical protein B0181_01555 [Moraxella caviae]|uniref:Outer membrane protein transport protein (OMPP1/FadL/TodX) n=1 Tax=Moraxella caviae TaxID=34060 RepID=A0A1T0AA95_9GAMM|nr:outer membrane protein transport protein [Moraxella caviae]OOR92664.1 hypothetical protein B0181_01555 [Moraxella caviae]STZ14413.1 Outer membrane protein transport protein (OMPP1/FadL/TodX) [Moraxella caviae]VEW10500.1 Outer membrane protein transport protein (OMPP1/FadL/TodX) [Moraxella caviae]